MSEHGTTNPPTPRQLFNDVVDLEAPEREARLAEWNDRAPALVAAVRKLLAADASAGTFLAGAAVVPAAAPPLKHVGPYKLLQEIGEGGFGTVYLAEQISPVRRRVAVKIVKPGMNTRQVIARFEAERQALAMMDHPNIARVFDAGQSPDHRPYFVMELVTGVPITQFCDDNRFDLRQRLSLFADVCRAVQHAHQKAIIHRDIKPNNVLVTLHDGKPVAKVIDFGIAKALDEPLTDKTLFTEFKTMIGTPEYMSPEQAEISGLDIDTRCDVYSLGVLLYELLVGVTPFDGVELRSKAYNEMQRIIREVDPPAPGARLSRLGAASTIADRRRSDPRRLRGLVRGELDWIVMRCLEKDRTRRYESAAALANDVEAYLRGDAIAAGPPSAVYRLRKFSRRHRVLIGTSAAVVLALVIGLIATLLALRQAQIARRSAEANAIVAQREAARAKVVSDFLEQTIGFADPYRGGGDPRISQVFEQAVRDLDAGKIAADPQTQAVLRATIGRVSLRIDREDIAVPQLEKAVEFRRSQQPRDVNELARALNLLSSAETNRANFRRADELRTEALQLARETGDAGLIDDIRYNHATSLLSRREYEQAVAILRELLELRQRRDPTNSDQIALLLEGLATAEANTRQLDTAIAHARQAVALRRAAGSGAYADDRALFESLGVLGTVLGMAGQDQAAVVEIQQAIDLLAKQQRPSQGTMTMLREMLAARLSRLGQRDRAIELLRECVESHRQFEGPMHPRVAQAKGNLGLELHRAGKPDEARRQWQEAWAIVRDRTDLPRGAAADIAGLLATVSTAADSPSQSELYEYALRDLRNQQPPRVMFVNTLMNYWLALHSAGRIEDALRVAEELGDVAPKVHPPESAELALTQVVLARSLLRGGGDPARVEALARSAIAAYEKHPPRVPAQLHHARSILGDALLRQGRIDAATGLIESADSVLSVDKAAAGAVRDESAERLRRLRQIRPAPAPATNPVP
jgi:serine/threonine protein kinase